MMLADRRVTSGQLWLLLAIVSVSVIMSAQPPSEINNCIDSRPTNATGQCEKGCKKRFYGFYCNKSCSVNCDAACSQETGNCLTGCNPRWFKSNCSRNCIGFCTDDICDIRSGECVHGCIKGYYGMMCDQKCSENCTGGECDEFGGCHCKKGVKDSACYLDCTDNCVAGKCALESSGQLTCLKGCKADRTGHFCQEWCPSNCSKCDPNGTCINEIADRHLRKRDLQEACCTDGQTGNNCSIKCPNCIYSSQCIAGCKGGYFGKECNLNCSNKCIKGSLGNPICDKNTGECKSGCLQGYHGFICSEPCNEKCFKNICHKDSGHCEQCIPNKYGSKCEYDCGHCTESNCGKNGTCNCKPGWYGLRCKDECKDTCISVDCRVDRKGTHVCVGACVDGYTGADCLEKCPSGCTKCDRRLGTCHHIQSGNVQHYLHVITVTIVVFGVVLVMFISAVVICWLRGRKRLKRLEHTDNVNEALWMKRESLERKMKQEKVLLTDQQKMEDSGNVKEDDESRSAVAESGYEETACTVSVAQF